MADSRTFLSQHCWPTGRYGLLRRFVEFLRFVFRGVLLTGGWWVCGHDQFINFRFMPLPYRVPFQQTCGVFWTLYLSLLNAASVFVVVFVLIAILADQMRVDIGRVKNKTRRTLSGKLLSNNHRGRIHLWTWGAIHDGITLHYILPTTHYITIGPSPSNNTTQSFSNCKKHLPIRSQHYIHDDSITDVFVTRKTFAFITVNCL